MAEVTKGIRSILSLPRVYDAFMTVLGSDRSRRILIDEYMRPRPGNRILDIGCGTGAILNFLPQGIDYLGVDLNPEYVASATRQHGGRARFRAADVNQLASETAERFDIITGWGLLHHLEDEEVSRLAKTVRNLLKAKGRFVTLDNCYAEGQSVVARKLIQWDRGRNVRTAPQYEALIAEVFDQVRCVIRHDLLRVPYTHVIFEASLR